MPWYCSPVNLKNSPSAFNGLYNQNGKVDNYSLLIYTLKSINFLVLECTQKHEKLFSSANEQIIRI